MSHYPASPIAPPHIDLTRELALLLEFVGDTSVAIRIHTSYGKTVKCISQQDLDDSMWLSDCMHNFDGLGRKIAARDWAGALAQCEFLISTFESYLSVESNPYWKSRPHETFKRHDHLTSLKSAIGILGAIHAKVTEGLKKPEDEPGWESFDHP